MARFNFGPCLFKTHDRDRWLPIFLVLLLLWTLVLSFLPYLFSLPTCKHWCSPRRLALPPFILAHFLPLPSPALWWFQLPPLCRVRVCIPRPEQPRFHIQKFPPSHHLLTFPSGLIPSDCVGNMFDALPKCPWIPSVISRSPSLTFMWFCFHTQRVGGAGIALWDQAEAGTWPEILALLSWFPWLSCFLIPLLLSPGSMSLISYMHITVSRKLGLRYTPSKMHPLSLSNIAPSIINSYVVLPPSKKG